MNEQNDFERQVEQEERAQTEPEAAEFSQDAPETNEIVGKIKELVKKGNVTKIVIKKNDNVLVNIPLNVGIVGGLLGIAAAPWAVVAAAVATAGFACKVELVKDDGEVVNINGKTISDTAKDVSSAVADMGNSVIDGLKDAVDSIKEQAADIEVEIQETPEEEKAPEDKTDL